MKTNVINFLPVPADLPIWKSREVNRLRIRISDETFEQYPEGGGQGREALYWKSNSQPVPVDCFRDAYLALPAGQQAAVDASIAAFVSERQRAAQRRSNPKTKADVLYALEMNDGELSPENLTCDGELSRAEITAKSRVLNAERRRLEKLLKTFS